MKAIVICLTTLKLLTFSSPVMWLKSYWIKMRNFRVKCLKRPLGDWPKESVYILRREVCLKYTKKICYKNQLEQHFYCFNHPLFFFFFVAFRESSSLLNFEVKTRKCFLILIFFLPSRYNFAIHPLSVLPRYSTILTAL